MLGKFLFLIVRAQSHSRWLALAKAFAALHSPTEFLLVTVVVMTALIPTLIAQRR